MHEATRRPDAGTRALLQQIAGRLLAERPQHPMRENTRAALALTFATRRHGHGTASAEWAEQQILRHAPAVEPGTSRGQYAAELLDAVGGAR
ncbi:hypothetical protein [Streptomyces lavendulae]|uniref:hypothetical protein n=1 Tax=Streptomyces lavendulae TaxID=1914 RepID=UPI0031EE45EE